MANEIYHRSNWGNAVNDIAWGDTYEKFDATNEMFVRSDNYENSNETDKLMAAINPKPSILLTPTAYDNGLLNSVKPVSGENLITYSEDFSQSAWNKSNTSIQINTTTSPSGNLDGSTLTDNATSSIHRLRDAVSLSASTNYSLSVFAKKNTLSNIQLALINTANSNTISKVFDLENGVIGEELSQGGTTVSDAKIENYGNGWFRCIIVGQLSSSPNQYQITLATQSTGNSQSVKQVTYSGDGTGSVFLYGAQLERGSKASTYTPTNGTAIKNGSFDFTRGSSATRVNEQGLIEDLQILSGDLVQNGNFEQIGSELVTNGGFDTDSNWTKYSNATISGGKAILTGGNSAISQSNLLTVNTNYVITYSVLFNNGSSSLTTNRGGSMLQASGLPDAVGTHTVYVKTLSSGAATFFISNLSNTSREIHIDNVSVKEVGQNWTFVGDTTVVNNGAKFDNTSVYSEIRQDNIITPNSKYRLTITVEDYTGGSIRFPQFGVANGNGDPNFIISANGTYVFEGVYYSTHLIMKRSVNGVDLVVSNISLIEITDDTDLPRIDYTDGTGSLLLEPQSTNLLPYSEDFSFWSSNEVTTQTGFLAPDGSSNATKVVSTGSNSYIVKSGGVFGNYARTIYARTVSGTGTLQLLSHNTNTNNSFTITENWQRFELNSTTEIASNFYAVDFRGSSTLSEVIIWGAQAEDLSYATSYIPTEGSTVTRDAEVCNNAGSSDLINSTEGVLYAEIQGLSDTDVTSRYISLTDGTITNSLFIQYRSNGELRLYNGGISTAQIIYRDAGADLTENIKLAIKYGTSTSDYKVYINGSSVTVAGAFVATSMSGLNELKFEYALGGGSFYGNVKSVAVFKEALTDEELTALTT